MAPATARAPHRPLTSGRARRASARRPPRPVHARGRGAPDPGRRGRSAGPSWAPSHIPVESRPFVRGVMDDLALVSVLGSRRVEIRYAYTAISECTETVPRGGP